MPRAPRRSPGRGRAAWCAGRARRAMMLRTIASMGGRASTLRPQRLRF
jgi:hypothetical protein